MESVRGFCQNKLLETLPLDVSARILKNMDLVQIYAGEVLYESGEKIQVVYFLIDCFISVLYETEDGSTTEMAALVMTELRVAIVMSSPTQQWFKQAGRIWCAGPCY